MNKQDNRKHFASLFGDVYLYKIVAWNVDI